MVVVCFGLVLVWFGVLLCWVLCGVALPRKISCIVFWCSTVRVAWCGVVMMWCFGVMWCISVMLLCDLVCCIVWGLWCGTADWP